MELAELTTAMHHFVRDRGWYGADSIHPQTLRNLAISLCIESSEVLEHFQWGEDSAHPEELAGELADVALYLLQISCVAGIDLEAAILEKLAKNYRRSWDQTNEEVQK